MSGHRTTDRLRVEGLALAAPGHGIGEVVEWAKLALDTYAASATSSPSSAERPSSAPAEHVSGVGLGWVGLAALAVGAHEAARALLGVLGARIAAAHSPLERRIYLLLVSRYLQWTGDLPLIGAVHWERVRIAFGALPPIVPRPRSSASGRAGGAVWETLLGELADAAESLGDGQLAAAARARSRTQEAVAGDAAALLPDAPGGEAWGSFALDIPDIGVRRWLADVLGVANSTLATGRRSVDEAAAGAAAGVILPLVHGLLGTAPDASRHRLVLRPALPREWSEAEVRGLQVGDAAISLRYRRDHGIFGFTVDQESGTVPIRLIFEPHVPARSLTRALIDGRDASLDSRMRGERLAVPVQVVLDHERTIELRTQDPLP